MQRFGLKSLGKTQLAYGRSEMHWDLSLGRYIKLIATQRWQLGKKFKVQSKFEQSCHIPRKHQKQTETFLAEMKRKKTEEPTQLTVNLIKSRHVHYKTICSAVDEDNGISSYLRRPRKLFTTHSRAIRVV